MMSRSVLITGASRGIGRAIAEAFARNGDEVHGTATSDDGAESIQQWLDENNWQGRGHRLNVTSAEQIDGLLAELAADQRSPEILINNAGITSDQLLMRMKEEDWASVIDTNLTAAFRLSKAVLRPMMKQRSGRIINITSVVAAAGNPGQSNYAASKAGLEGFTKSFAREIGSRGITVNCVAPGYIDTEMTQNLGEDIQKQFLAQIPIGRLGEPSEVAHTVLFLASEQSAYITGQTIHVNGGLLMS